MPTRHQVIMLPGGVMPAQFAYTDLLDRLGATADVRVKELEIYAGAQPPPDYTLNDEVAGILRLAHDAGFGQFHLAGYSAGGAGSVAFAAAHPQRLISLTLNEPAWAGHQHESDAEQRLWARFAAIGQLPDEAMMPAFMAAQIAPDVPLPARPDGPPPPWMATRPAGLRTFLRIFTTSDLDLEGFRRFPAPVLYTLGGKSNPDYYAEQARRLAAIFPDFTLVEFPSRHHFDPPHRVEADRMAAVLREFWDRSDP